MKTKDFEFSAPTNRAENWKGNENKVLNIKMVKCIKFSTRLCGHAPQSNVDRLGVCTLANAGPCIFDQTRVALGAVCACPFALDPRASRADSSAGPRPTRDTARFSRPALDVVRPSLGSPCWARANPASEHCRVTTPTPSRFPRGFWDLPRARAGISARILRTPRSHQPRAEQPTSDQTPTMSPAVRSLFRL